MIPTFGLRNIGRAAGYGKGAEMSGLRRTWEGAKGVTKLTGTAAVVGTTALGLKAGHEATSALKGETGDENL